MQFDPCFFVVERTVQVYSASRFLFKTRTVNVFSFLTLYDVRLNLSCDKCFYALGLKGSPGASSNRIVRPSVCLSVRLSVRNSVPLTNKVQYLKFGWWYSNQTWTVASSTCSSHFTDITCPWGWGWGGVKMLDLGIFAIFIPPATKLGGVYWNHHVRLSVRPSVSPSVRPHLGFRRITAFLLHLSPWNFTCRLPMSQGCAL